MKHEILKAVPWLSSLGEGALDEVAGAGQRVSFAPGGPLLVELEVGEELFILLEGNARVTVSAGGGSRRQLATLGPGDACGEMSLVTRELHSATVVAESEVLALRIERLAFERLVARHPHLAVHFARVLATRLCDTEQTLDALLRPTGAGADVEETAGVLSGRSPAALPTGGSLARAWREHIVSGRRELPFFALSSFLLTLCATRGSAALLSLAGRSLFGFLRGAYTLGILAVFITTALSLLRFRRKMLRILAIVYGIGFALILNELSVFLTFDTFYLDMTTRDPNLVFDVELLYRRSESQWAIALMVALLVQLTFFLRFYRRAFFVIGARVRSLVSGR
jgi:CRP-like cAMP-binding protein